MELTEQQRQAVKDWLASGASLSDVQRSLKSEFNLTMTYIDVRLLVLDIGAAVKDKPEPKPVKAEPPEPPAFEEDEELEYEPGEPPAAADAGEGPADAAAANISLTLDRLVVPGAMVSGSVVFSDGVKARWLIDQYGRFGLEPEKPGYRPTGEDMQAFQMKLRAELRRHGYA